MWIFFKLLQCEQTMVHITSVTFDNATNGEFASGTYIKGTLLLSSSSATRLAGLSVVFEGKAKLSFTTSEVKWFKEHKRYNAKTGKKEEVSFDGVFDTDWKSIKVRRRLSDSEVFYAKEKYCELTHQLFGEMDLPAGDSSFPFSFVLPPSMPSSYTGKHGHIRYKLKVKLNKAKVFSANELFKTELNIYSPKDLSRLRAIYPWTFEPVEYRDGKEFSCLWFSCGELSLVIRLHRSVLVSGETIMIRTEVDNSSDVEIIAIVFKLIMRSVWIGKRGHTRNVKFHDDVLAEYRCDRPLEGRSRWWDQPLLVPPVQSLNLDSCSIIKLYHLITVEVIPKGLHLNLTTTIPVEVSSTPIADIIGFVLPQSSTEFALTQAPSGSGSVMASTSYNTGFNLAQTSDDIFFGPVPRNIGFAHLPSAPISYSSIDSDPPPPYPGTPDSIPSYKDATNL